MDTDAMDGCHPFPSIARIITAAINPVHGKNSVALLRLRSSNQDKPRLEGQTSVLNQSLLINHKE
jgi:hypothetical protein